VSLASSSRLPWLVLAIGAVAVAVGGVFVGRAVVGEDALSSWISAGTGLVAGGCCVVWGIRQARRVRRRPMTE
jgi:hypothetical protein